MTGDDHIRFYGHPSLPDGTPTHCHAGDVPAEDGLWRSKCKCGWVSEPAEGFAAPGRLLRKHIDDEARAMLEGAR